MKKINIIAEIGVNHCGKLQLAKKIIDLSKKIGADYVKFQTYITDELVTKNSSLADYQKKNLKSKLTQYEMLKKYELSFEAFNKLIKYCKKKKIGFISTPFDRQSALFLLKINCKIIKISSGDLTDFNLLECISKFKGKILLSTGRSSFNEVKKSLRFLIKKGKKKKDIVVMQCTSDYPTKDKDLNLNVIDTFKKKLKVSVGFSDHSQSQVSPIIAGLKGCNYIEKHITLSKKLPGPDHKASFDINEFRQMILNVRSIDKILGSEKKYCTRVENKNKVIVRKSLVAKTDIKKGELFSKKNLTTKRPLKGIDASNWFYFLNKRAKKNYKKNQFIKNEK